MHTSCDEYDFLVFFGFEVSDGQHIDVVLTWRFSQGFSSQDGQQAGIVR